MRKDSGFTLIELIVTISVAAILVGIGIPSMTDLMKTNRRASAVNSLVSQMQLARSTAASRGVAVSLCHSSNASSCSGQEDPDWAQGWVLFIDNNQDGNPDATDGNGNMDAGETLVSTGAARNGVTMPSNRTSFAFNPGFQLGTAGTVAVCVDKENVNARWIAVGTTGRPRLSKDRETDDPDCTTLGP
ncbi:MAG TPA: GspH/FimT family pseudopilin [Gammaproteobacteria bacterium]